VKASTPLFYLKVNTLNFSNGKISYNTAEFAGGVYSSGNFTIAWGEISNNVAGDSGVYVMGICVLSGGRLLGNIASGNGGGVWVDVENLDKLCF
jgi:hypothetical protein